MHRGIEKHRYFATIRINDSIPARTGYLSNFDLEYLLKSEKSRRESEYSFGAKVGFTKVEYWGTYFSETTQKEEVVLETIELDWTECLDLLGTIEKGGNIR